MARDYAAEYAARAERAREHGFSGYGAERGYIQRHGEYIQAGIEETGARDYTEFGPKELAGMGLSAEYVDTDIPDDKSEWGELAHDIVGGYIELGYTEGEAIAAMHEILGETP